jgi:ribosomal protein S15P/S13E
MNITCNQLDDLLFDAGPLAMETATKHAGGCPSCREKLDSWNEISGVARSMHTTWQNDMLWPRIERSLRDERRRSLRNWSWQWAAAVIMTIALGATVWFAVSVRNAEESFDQDILRVSAMDDVERAEEVHVKAIAQLEKVAEARLEENTSPLMVSYKEKLMLLDDAIAECQTHIEQNRQNAHLRKQLLAMYTEKQQTLRDVLREDTTNETR